GCSLRLGATPKKNLTAEAQRALRERGEERTFWQFSLCFLCVLCTLRLKKLCQFFRLDSRISLQFLSASSCVFVEEKSSTSFRSAVACRTMPFRIQTFPTFKGIK
ncbi:MAG: hypothetical protein ACRD82_21410, partial [Blastocatellia bacterium]